MRATWGRALVLAATASLGVFFSAPAQAEGCPLGYTQVGTQKEETATAIITHPVCLPDEDAKRCEGLRLGIEQMASASVRASLALDVYSLYDQTGGWLAPWKAPPGYTLLSNDIRKDRQMFPGMSDLDIAGLIAPVGSSYRAAVYRHNKTRTIVLVFRGTTEQLADYTAANIPNEFGMWTKYFANARDLGRTLNHWADRNGYELEIVGHSLGGGMATAAALAAHVHTTEFNAEAFRSNHFEGGGADEDALAQKYVTNYVTSGEALTALQKTYFSAQGIGLVVGPALGHEVELPDWPGSPASPFERHEMWSVRLALHSHLETLKKDYADSGCVP